MADNISGNRICISLDAYDFPLMSGDSMLACNLAKRSQRKLHLRTALLQQTFLTVSKIDLHPTTRGSRGVPFLRRLCQKPRRGGGPEGVAKNGLDLSGSATGRLVRYMAY
eukprot:215261-Pelagomonas_calceolata.AAC.7